VSIRVNPRLICTIRMGEGLSYFLTLLPSILTACVSASLRETMRKTTESADLA
jgi:hypothetical protein